MPTIGLDGFIEGVKLAQECVAAEVAIMLRESMDLFKFSARDGCCLGG